jgi:ATP-dependent Clp protease adaptor protein ClpS
MGDIATEQITKEKNSLAIRNQEPKKYKVVFLNDDKTPMEFVIEVLMNIFNHDDQSSHELTIKIHTEGSAVVGVYPFEIAEQKGIETTQLARQAGYPLNVKIESE